MSFTLPHQELEMQRQMFAKTERCPIEQPLWPEPMSYFNNLKKRTFSNLYDTIMNQEPGYNQYSHRDDREDLGAIHENIFQQEKEKCIPVITSLTYGRPKLVSYDTMDTKYGKVHVIKNFYNRFGINMSTDSDTDTM